jgi:hypothetical protein
MSAIPTGITREHVLGAIRTLDSGEAHDFGDSTRYDLVHEGRRYPPKAVIGLAARNVLGRALGPYDFKGGEQSQAFRILRTLRFVIEPKGNAAQSGEDWSEDEIYILVDDYFEMLRKDRTGLSYSKAEHNRRAQELLPGRSKGSIEFKHQNVSAILHEAKYPFLPGYKPARNYQRQLLPDIVLSYIDSRIDTVVEIERAIDSTPDNSEPIAEFAGCEVQPPPKGPASDDRDGQPKQPRRARHYDFAARDAANRNLGRAGENFIVGRERWYLTSVGRADLAARVDWIADREGDGLGYDIASYDPATGSPIYIEVKTTNSGAEFPFYLSPNEIEASVDLGAQYRLYRVFNLSTSPQFYSVQGNLQEAFHLKPRMYEARRA